MNCLLRLFQYFRYSSKNLYFKYNNNFILFLLWPFILELPLIFVFYAYYYITIFCIVVVNATFIFSHFLIIESQVLLYLFNFYYDQFQSLLVTEFINTNYNLHVFPDNTQTQTQTQTKEQQYMELGNIMEEFVNNGRTPPIVPKYLEFTDINKGDLLNNESVSLDPIFLKKNIYSYSDLDPLYKKFYDLYYKMYITENQQGVIQIPLSKLIVEHLHTIWADNFDTELLGKTMYLSEVNDVFYVHPNFLPNYDNPLYYEYQLN